VWMTVILDTGLNLQRSKNSSYQSSSAMLKQVKKWSTSWCMTFNILRISEFHSYYPSFVCVDSFKERCECVITVLWSSTQSTL
jgi:hypothetical protein